MTQYAFPSNVRILSCVPTLVGMRFEPFTNIDGESFAKPTLNGFWRVEMEVLALNERAALALSAYITAMSGSARSLVPVCPQYRPFVYSGRLAGIPPAPDHPTDYTGFAAQAYDGLTLRTAAFHRDSYIDVDHPDDLQVWPGHFISIGDSLHQIVQASALDERDDRSRLQIKPSVRGDHDPGDVVFIDWLRMRSVLIESDQIGFGIGRHRQSRLTFIEAF